MRDGLLLHVWPLATKGYQVMSIPAKIVALLNEALALDPNAVESLVDCSIPCNAALAAHPSIVVKAPITPDFPPRVNLLGFLSGLTTSKIEYELEINGKIRKFFIAGDKDGQSTSKSISAAKNRGCKSPRARQHTDQPTPRQARAR